MKKSELRAFVKKLLQERIRKVDGKYIVYPKKGGKRLGTHSTKKAAEKQLTAIHLNKEYVNPANPSKVNPKELEMGIEVEMEHTDNPKKAEIIALQHLAEDPQYYSKLASLGLEETKLKKRDRCLKIADRKYDKPSAYKSGAVVRCRKGDIWKGIKEALSELNEAEKESLHKWFSRRGAKGSASGWVDCNAPDGKGGYKSCGRQKGEKRSKYPACRPTPAKCKDKGKGKSWGKTKTENIHDPVRPGILKNQIKGKVTCTKARALKSKQKNKSNNTAKAAQRFLNYHDC